MTFDLRDRVRFLRAERLPDEGGGAALARREIGFAWGEATALPALRDASGERDVFRKRYDIRVRREDFPAAATHAELFGTALRIQSAAPDADGQPFINLTCEEGRP